MKCFEIIVPYLIKKNPVFPSACVSLSLVKVLNLCRQDAPLSVIDYGKWNLNL